MKNINFYLKKYNSITYFIFVQLGVYESELNWSNRQTSTADCKESTNISKYLKFFP